MSNNNDTNILTMVDRACVIIEHLYQMTGPASIAALSKELNLPKANIFRILYTLQQRGLIEKTSDSDQYKLGKKMIKYGEKVKYDFDLVEAAIFHMKNLAKEIGESVNLGIEHEGKVITLHSEKGEQSALVSKIIPVSDLHCSSMGKIVLAEKKDDELKDYFSQDLEKRTITTIVELGDFLKEKDSIVKDFLSFDREEYDYGLACIATGLRDESSNLIAMLSISGPSTRLQYKGIDRIIEKLKEKACLINEAIVK